MKRRKSLFTVWVVFVMLSIAAGGCSSSEAPEPEGGVHEQDEETPSLSAVSLGEGERLRVVATTSIVADVVKNVGGQWLELSVLTPVGTDPHSYEPTPKDIAAAADAHVVFANGAGLEAFLEPLLESAGASDRVVDLSVGVELYGLEGGDAAQDGHADPHTWMDPNNVLVWVRNIEQALRSLDPGRAGDFEANAVAYEAELEALDAWIVAQVDQVPEAQRRMVTDHTTLGYFVQRYGFQVSGTVVPGYSALAEPSAQELAELQDAIRDLDVKAVFVGNTVNPSLAQRVAEDTGVQLVSLYTGSLSKADGPAGSYLAYMRHNVSQIVGALK